MRFIVLKHSLHKILEEKILVSVSFVRQWRSINDAGISVLLRYCGKQHIDRGFGRGTKVYRRLQTRFKLGSVIMRMRR